MTRLGLFDQAFIKLEQGGMSPMYLGGAMILDPSDSPYPVDGKAIANHLAAVMEEIPLMRQKLVQDTMRLGDMRLVDDPDFDVNNHVTLVQLPAPGGYSELTEYLGRFSVERLDLCRPLWHYEVIEGLEGGRIAVATHLHHAILDGVGASRTLGGMYSSTPIRPRKPLQKKRETEPEPGNLGLMGGAVLENARRLYVETPAFMLKNAWPLLRTISDELGKRLRPRDESKQTSSRMLPKPQKTSLSAAQLSDSRVVAYLELPLADIKALQKMHDCSVNDLALYINSVALEHYFNGISEPVDFDLIAGMPLDTREEGDDSAGNAVALARVNLHNTIADPKKRLASITKDTREIKASLSRARSKKNSRATKIDYGALSALFSPIILEAVFYIITRFSLLEKVPALLNVAITNVPGSPQPQYVAGARLVSMIPMAPCGDTLGLTITISSTEGLLLIGYHGCGETIQDKELLVEGAYAAIERLQGKGGTPGKRKAGQKTAAKRKKGVRKGRNKIS